VKNKILMVVNVDWFFLSHRLPIALAAIDEGYEVHVATSLTQPRDKLEKFGLIVHPIDLHRGKVGFLSIITYFLNLISLLKKIKPNLIHLVTIKPVLLGGIAARIMRVPAVVYAISGMGYVYIGTSITHKLLRKFISFLYMSALNHFNSIVILQNPTDMKDIVRIAKLKHSSARIIKGSGVNISQYKLTDLPSGRPIIMLPSRFLRDKGIYEFIEAARGYSNTNIVEASPRFVLVGETDPENKATIKNNQLKKWEMEGVIENWGFQTDMVKVLSQSTIIVLPSYREGLPKVLLEAAACGRPIITTDVPGCRDAIIPNVTGRLIQAKDPLAIQMAIKELLDDRELLKKMGKHGRIFAEENFDLSDVIAEHLQIYHSLIEAS
jgi:glycosyltransferase involved in cell wall biosynthesis